MPATPEEKEAREAKEASGAKADPVPFGKFFKNGSFWALMAAHFTWNYFSYGLLAAPPSSLRPQRDLTKSSFLSILPYLATVAVTTIVAPTADSGEERHDPPTSASSRRPSASVAVPSASPSSASWSIPPPEAVTQTTVITVMSSSPSASAWVLQATASSAAYQDMSPSTLSIMLGITNTAAAIASTSPPSSPATSSPSPVALGLVLFFPIAALQAITVLLFQSSV